MNAHAFVLWSIRAAAVTAAVMAFPIAACGQEDVPRVEYGAQNLKDPFKTYVVKEAKPDQPAVAQIEPEVVKPAPTLNIQGIFWGGQYPQAIVNDTVVKEGQVIEEAKVMSIQRDGVKFLFANREIFVAPTPVKTGMTESSKSSSSQSSQSRKEAP
jgi:hypothetical protein